MYGPDLVIFSFDRPLQLYALLESIERYISGLNSIQVIYRISSLKFEMAYQEVQQRFSSVVFYKQSEHPLLDFKPLVIKTVYESNSPYILFAVDDNIIKDFIDVKESIQYMEQYGAYGFYLKMGLNLNSCYPLQRAQSIPPHAIIDTKICIWQFKTGEYDWGYPNTVDMTIYRKDDIRPYIVGLHYTNPNNFEGIWASQSAPALVKVGTCYIESKIVNLPLNQSIPNGNFHMNWLNCEQLLEKFTSKLKINIEALYKIDNKSVHMPYIPPLITR